MRNGRGTYPPKVHILTSKMPFSQVSSLGFLGMARAARDNLHLRDTLPKFPQDQNLASLIKLHTDSQTLSGKGDSQRDSRESIRANNPYFYSANRPIRTNHSNFRFARITPLSANANNFDSRKSIHASSFA